MRNAASINNAAPIVSLPPKTKVQAQTPPAAAPVHAAAPAPPAAAPVTKVAAKQVIALKKTPEATK